MMKSQDTKVFVGLSGGVDSSVSAALLKKQGYRVVGVFIKIWQPEWQECSMKEDRLDAMRVCASLNIPFREIDLTEAYKKEVVDYMIAEYRRGRTPNPDVACNRFIKFGKFFDWAIAEGADFVATGHYARKKLHAHGFRLITSKDAEKDQTYFLWTLTQSQLAKTLFPVGNLTKKEVRIMAKKFKLPTAEKKDSQGLCFVGKVNIKDFLSRYIEEKRGTVLNERGEIIGYHHGACFLTIGERHGFTVTNKVSAQEPLYVISKDVSKNTLVVGSKSSVSSYASERVSLRDVNWFSPVNVHKTYRAQIRYHGARYLCELEKGKDFVHFFEKPNALAYGQSLVIYDGKTLLGGGIMEPTLL